MRNWARFGGTMALVVLAACSADMEVDTSAADEADAAAPAEEMGEELREIEGGGELAGFMGRTDNDQPFDDVLVTAMEDGFQVDNGPAVVLWRDDMTATGDYTLSATFEQLSSKGHPHGTGLVFGGSEMDGPNQRYTYFMVMGDGTYLVKTREGEETFWQLPSGGWTASDVVNASDANDQYTNELSVQVAGDEVIFRVNGTEVHRGAKADLFTDGNYGVRANHNLTIRFSTPEVSTGM